MAYFATVVTPVSPEWALGGVVVLLSTPVTIICDLTLNSGHVPLQLRFRCTSRTLQLTNVFRCGLHSQRQLLSFLKSEVFFCQESPLNHLASQSTYESVAQGFFEVLFEITLFRELP